MSLKKYARIDLSEVRIMGVDFEEAEHMFSDWCVLTVATKITELKTMANTIRTHIEGILTYWTRGGWTSAAVEGFNNKILWLIKQAYGYREPGILIYQKTRPLEIYEIYR